MARIFLRTSGAVHAAVCLALGAFVSEAGLPAIGCPTLVLVGVEDYATPPTMARTLRDGVAGAELVELAEVRHLSLVESRDARDRALAYVEHVAGGVGQLNGCT